MEKLQTIFAVAYQDRDSGGVDWFNDQRRYQDAQARFAEVCADKDLVTKDVVLFWFTMPAKATDEEITTTADDFMANMPAGASATMIATALRRAGWDDADEFEILGTRLVDPFADQFMRPNILEGDYYEIETSHGTEYVPAVGIGDLGLVPGVTRRDDDGEPFHEIRKSLSDYVEGDVREVTAKHGWLARMSAPGYMDCTDWTAHESYHDAWAYLVDNYAE